MNRASRIIAVFACLTVAALIAGCGSSGSGGSGSPSASAEKPAKGGTPVNFVLEFAISPSQEGFFSGMSRGFFAKEGLNVKYQVPGEVSVPVQAVATGKADFAVVLSTLSASAKAAGAPIKVIATIEPHMGIGMMVLPQKVHKFTDIKGTTVGNQFLPQEQICFARQLKKYGMKKNEISLVNPGYNLVSTLLEGKVSMVVGSINYESQIVKAISGKEAYVYQYTEVCPPFNIQLITSDKMIKEHPETVRKFVKAELEGTAWVAHHPVEAAKEFVKRFPDQVYKQIVDQSTATAPTYCDKYSEKNGLGYNDPTYWQELIDMTASDPSILKKSYPQSELVTNEFLPKPALTEACAGEFYKKSTGTEPIR